VHHIVWDWNGTLLDDLAVVVVAVNDTLATVGRRPITIEEYGAQYTRPVLLFYERLLGRAVEESEWRGFDEAFHASYRRQVDSASLATDAMEAITAVHRAGLSQSLLSMYWHDELVPQVSRFDLGRFLVRIDGLRGTPGDRKQAYLEQHLRAVSLDLSSEIPPSEILVIGDALDDADAASALGLNCVLYNGGAHPVEQLVGAGVPVVDSLMEALRFGGVPLPGREGKARL
jgi:phosphoglycolate phosphatase-like HAD superfamily hydrolase